MAALDWHALDPRLWPAAEHGRLPRRFTLWRERDRSGVSGTGAVATGVQFATGHCVLEWSGAPYGLGLYRSLFDVEQVHGHGGDTVVVWIDRD